MRDDRIESGRRFIVEDGPRVGDHGPREAGALDHAARQLGWKAIADRRQADALERLLDMRLDFVVRTSWSVRATVARRCRRSRVNRTAPRTGNENPIFSRITMSSRSCKVEMSLIPNQHASFVGPPQAVEQTQDRRLAGARKTDDAGDRALDDVEREVLHHDFRAVANADVLEPRIELCRRRCLRHCGKRMYESAKLKMKIRMIAMTTADGRRPARRRRRRRASAARCTSR